MRRRIFNTLSALSLLLCVAIGVLWVRSYWVDELVTYLAVAPDFRSRTQLDAASYYGCARLGYIRIDEALRPTEPTGLYYRGWKAQAPPPDGPPWRAFHYALARRFNYVVLELRVPHWLLMLGAAILPAVWLRTASRKRRRLRHGLCPKCGYDLRASEERCPECGTAVPART